MDHLEPEHLARVEALLAAATEADGVPPLDEQALFAVRDGSPALHLTIDVDGELAGYVHATPAPPAVRSGDTAPADAGSLAAELVVHPAYRRRGVGTRLLSDLIDAAGDRRLRIWAHGGHPGVEPLAARFGLTPVRRLLRMRRALAGPDAEPLPVHPVPDGVLVRAFHPGRDDAGLVAANAAAFAGHPEQAAMTLEDLHARMGRSWFDPAGVFVAVPADTGPEATERIIGFHWTKVHAPAVRGEPDDEGIGEIYVLGIDPAAAVPGLGKALAVIGLHHLAARGLPAAMLFTESDNVKAIGLYEKLGFSVTDIDTMYA